ncbi:MAG TPA: DUF4296 domain-containing protein [Puia sp.]|jgi:hypothetical protein|nr:DUF4296 domain-containing protein [Puia sp.]
MRRAWTGWLIVGLLAVGIGCSDKKGVPSGVLAREDMQMVLWDMIQADQYATFFAKDSAHLNLKLENMRLYEQVFQLHHVSREEFARSYKYYMAHPELTQTLLDSLIAMGNRIRDESYRRAATRPPANTPPLTTVPAAPPAAQTSPRTVPTPPTAARKIADSLRKRAIGLPVTPTRPPVKRD